MGVRRSLLVVVISRIIRIDHRPTNTLPLTSCSLGSNTLPYVCVRIIGRIVMLARLLCFNEEIWLERTIIFLLV
jgi:hypothetical protein